LKAFSATLDAGINMALGTDTYPLDMFSEMRTASAVCKMVEKNHESAGAMDVFSASNLGGARALGRDDLGHLAPRAKADHRAGRLPVARYRAGARIRSARSCTSRRRIWSTTVIVDGRTLVRGKRLLICDEQEVIDAARSSARRIWSHFPDYDWAGRGIEEAFPSAI